MKICGAIDDPEKGTTQNGKVVDRLNRNYYKITGKKVQVEFSWRGEMARCAKYKEGQGIETWVRVRERKRAQKQGCCKKINEQKRHYWKQLERFLFVHNPPSFSRL